RRIQPSAAFALKNENAQGLLPARDHDSVFSRLQHFARRGRTLPGHVHLPELEQLRSGFTGQKSVSAGPEDEGADAVPQGARRLRPVQTPVFLRELASVAGILSQLFARYDVASDVVGDRFDQKIRADGAEPVMQ